MLGIRIVNLLSRTYNLVFSNQKQAVTGMHEQNDNDSNGLKPPYSTVFPISTCSFSDGPRIIPNTKVLSMSEFQ
jgi:hypothetical protein